MQWASTFRMALQRMTSLVLIIAVMGFSILPTTPSGASAINPEKRFIRSIQIFGNHYLRAEVIKNKLPYKVGDQFDPLKSSDALYLLYGMGYFHNIQLETQDVGTDAVDLFVLLEENQLLEKIQFKHNHALSDKKLREKLNLGTIETMSAERLMYIAQAIEKLYADEGYLYTKVTPSLVTNPENPQKVLAVFDINEGPYSHIVRINFVGNHSVPDRKIREFLMTRERWILSFMDGSGKYNEEQLSFDKHRIEMLYRDLGYLNTKVTDARVLFSDNKEKISITFTIQEGDLYIVQSISAPGDDIYLEEDLLPYIIIESGKPFSQTKLLKSLENLKDLWGKKGFINADVYPEIKPNEEDKTLDIVFRCERGNPTYVNRINITGNEFTRDKVIRRRIDIEEGDLITSTKLRDAQNAIEHLSFFERGGVNWKLHRITDTLSDLEMNVHETKTGTLQANLSYGIDKNSPKRAIRLGVQFGQRNLFGLGWSVGLNANVQLARQGTQTFEGSFLNPNIFDRNLAFGVSGFHKKVDYVGFVNVNRAPSVRESGASAQLGFSLPKISPNLDITFNGGWEFMGTNEQSQNGQAGIIACGPGKHGLQVFLDRAFAQGGYQWFGLDILYDTRNHMVYPNHGSKLNISNLLVLPWFNKHYAFFKAELDASYYTPLIGEDALVLALHAHAGFMVNLANNKYIPYKELFLIGGQDTVRGFEFGSVGPAWRNCDPLGGRKAIYVNAELIFPIAPDFSMKGHVFYDGGAGWDTPKKGVIPDLITRNKFNWRHSVGFGLNILRPTPAKLDWGYKLDRDKAAGEPEHEFHISMNMAW